MLCEQAKGHSSAGPIARCRYDHSHFSIMGPLHGDICAHAARRLQERLNEQVFRPGTWAGASLMIGVAQGLQGGNNPYALCITQTWQSSRFYIVTEVDVAIQAKPAEGDARRPHGDAT